MNAQYLWFSAMFPYALTCMPCIGCFSCLLSYERKRASCQKASSECESDVKIPIDSYGCLLILTAYRPMNRQARIVCLIGLKNLTPITKIQNALKGADVSPYLFPGEPAG